MNTSATNSPSSDRRSAGSVEKETPSELLRWILGSTVPAFSGSAPQWIQTENLENVAKRAREKIPVNQTGAIPPRVAKEVVKEAVWAESGILQEYLAGVLASSHSVQGKNDKGVSWASMIGQLSTDQLALHWALYSSTQRRCRLKDWESIWEVTQTQFIVDFADVLSSLGWLSNYQRRSYDS